MVEAYFCRPISPLPASLPSTRVVSNWLRNEGRKKGASHASKTWNHDHRVLRCCTYGTAGLTLAIHKQSFVSTAMHEYPSMSGSTLGTYVLMCKPGFSVMLRHLYAGSWVAATAEIECLILSSWSGNVSEIWRFDVWEDRVAGTDVIYCQSLVTSLYTTFSGLVRQGRVCNLSLWFS